MIDEIKSSLETSKSYRIIPNIKIVKYQIQFKLCETLNSVNVLYILSLLSVSRVHSINQDYNEMQHLGLYPVDLWPSQLL